MNKQGLLKAVIEKSVTAFSGNRHQEKRLVKHQEKRPQPDAVKCRCTPYNR